MSTRCLSAITLASKCTAPAFRMHVRAHGTVAKFFRALHDATNDQVIYSSVSKKIYLCNHLCFNVIDIFRVWVCVRQL